MIPRYLDSTPGRLLLAAASLALVIGGSYALGAPLTILAAGMPVVIVLGFLACGLSIAEHGAQAIAAVIALPVALLLFAVGVGVARSEHRIGFAWGFVALGVLLAVRAIGVPSLPAAQNVRTNE